MSYVRVKGFESHGGEECDCIDFEQNLYVGDSVTLTEHCVHLNRDFTLNIKILEINK